MRSFSLIRLADAATDSNEKLGTNGEPPDVVVESSGVYVGRDTATSVLDVVVSATTVVSTTDSASAVTQTTKATPTSSAVVKKPIKSTTNTSDSGVVGKSNAMKSQGNRSKTGASSSSSTPSSGSSSGSGVSKKPTPVVGDKKTKPK